MRPDLAAKLQSLLDAERPREQRLVQAQTLLMAQGHVNRVLGLLGEASAQLVDRRYLNAAPPTDPFFGQLVARLEQALDEAPFSGQQMLAHGLAVAARVAGRRWDAAAERAHKLIVEYGEGRWEDFYDQGLFFKTRGRWTEAFEANIKAAERCGSPLDEALLWNLGICATALGDGETALDLWQTLGCTVELGEDGLPRGSWPPMQVRLAERPLAERSAEQDDPGLEETVWVERLSPCHGRVVNATVQELGVDYGDLVLFDGAAILWRELDGREVPVHPHLVTLRRSGYRTLPFAGTQLEPGQIAGLSLPPDTQLYVHTEQLRRVCRACWERPGDHSHDERPRKVVQGKLVLPPDADLEAVRQAIQAAAIQGARVYVPELWRLLGDEARATVQERRMGLLEGAASED